MASGRPERGFAAGDLVLQPFLTLTLNPDPNPDPNPKPKPDPNPNPKHKPKPKPKPNPSQVLQPFDAWPWASAVSIPASSVTRIPLALGVPTWPKVSSSWPAGRAGHVRLRVHLRLRVRSRSGNGGRSWLRGRATAARAPQCSRVEPLRGAAQGTHLTAFGPPGALVHPSALLGAAGQPGLTAFVGVEHVVRPRAGETVLVSGAAGAVGSAALSNPNLTLILILTLTPTVTLTDPNGDPNLNPPRSIACQLFKRSYLVITPPRSIACQLKQRYLVITPPRSIACQLKQRYLVITPPRSIACQLFKRHGCRVVGLCGSAEKGAWLLGAGIVDRAIDYKGCDLARELSEERAEIYWDNAGKLVSSKW